MNLGKNIRVNTSSKIWEPVYKETIKAITESLFNSDKEYLVWRLIVDSIYKETHKKIRREINEIR